MTSWHRERLRLHPNSARTQWRLGAIDTDDSELLQTVYFHVTRQSAKMRVDTLAAWSWWPSQWREILLGERPTIPDSHTEVQIFFMTKARRNVQRSEIFLLQIKTNNWLHWLWWYREQYFRRLQMVSVLLWSSKHFLYWFLVPRQRSFHDSGDFSPPFTLLNF